MTNTQLPDASQRRTDADYARELMKRTGLSQRKLAERLDLSDRQLRYYASGEDEMAYTVQYAMEVLAQNAQGGNMNAVQDKGQDTPKNQRTQWFDVETRPLQKSDDGKLIVAIDRFKTMITGKLKKDDFGVFVADVDGIDVHRIPVANVVNYVLLDPPPTANEICEQRVKPAGDSND